MTTNDNCKIIKIFEEIINDNDYDFWDCVDKCDKYDNIYKMMTYKASKYKDHYDIDKCNLMYKDKR